MNNLNKYFDDIKYYNIISDIIENDKIKKLNENKHHGITRLEHSVRVSYQAYKLAYKLKLNYRAVARAGLLHDFFLNSDLEGKKKDMSMFFHPYKALENSCHYFDLTEMEKDIIITHMFPTLPHKIPKYLESWLVDIIDDVAAIYERSFSVKRELSASLSVFALMIINYIR